MVHLNKTFTHPSWVSHTHTHCSCVFLLHIKPKDLKDGVLRDCSPIGWLSKNKVPPNPMVIITYSLSMPFGQSNPEFSQTNWILLAICQETSNHISYNTCYISILLESAFLTMMVNPRSFSSTIILLPVASIYIEPFTNWGRCSCSGAKGTSAFLPCSKLHR